MLLGTVALFLGISAIAVHDSIARAAELTPSDVAALVGIDGKFINTALKGGTPEKKSNVPIKSSALMVAVYAQAQITGKDAAEDLKFASMRDNALKVYKAIASKKYADAVAPAKALAAMEVDPGASVKPVDILKETKADIDDLMAQFKKSGLDLETQIKAQSKKAGKPEDAAAIGARMLVIVDLMATIHPDFGGKKNQAAWTASSKEMKVASEEVLKAATSKDAKKISAAMLKLDGSCTSCHNVFK